MSDIWYWEVDNDPGTGRTFFVYRPTGESQWDVPKSLIATANGLGYDVDLDPSSGRVFYAEIASGSTFWETPLRLAGLTPGLSDDVVILSDWIIELDTSTGRSYFVQKSTGESQWDVPPALLQGMYAMGWTIDLDPGTGRSFYTHEASATTQWELPPTLFPLSIPSGDQPSRPPSRTSSRASRPASRASRPASRGSTAGSRSRPPSSNAGSSRPGSRAGGRRKKRGAASSANGTDSLWQENKDSSGGVFWFNTKTGEVTTNKPDELKTEEERLGITTDNGDDEGGEDGVDGEDGVGGVGGVGGEGDAADGGKGYEGKLGGGGKGKSKKEPKKDRGFELILPERRTKKHWETARSEARMLAVWGNWEAWREDNETNIGLKFWYDTTKEITMLEDPLALSSSDEEYMDSDMENDAVGWTEMKVLIATATLDDEESSARLEGKDSVETKTKDDAAVKRAQESKSAMLSDDDDDDDDEEDEDKDEGKVRTRTEAKEEEKKEQDITSNEGKQDQESEEERKKRLEQLEQDLRAKRLDEMSQQITIEEINNEERELLLNRRQMYREDWKERVRRRREQRTQLREQLGDARPKPSKIDMEVNKCLHHPLGFLFLGGLGFQEMPRRPLRQASKFLRHVSVQDNGLRFLSESDLEKRLSCCPNLEVLNFRQNMLTKLPDNFGLLTGLRALSLANNQIAELPLSVFLMTALTSLSLAHNHFNVMPSELGVKVMRQYRVWEMGWGNLTQLTSLDLSANRFDQLPTHLDGSQREAQFGNLWSLTHLDMSENFFKELPGEFYSLNSLTDLSIADNRMHGTVDVEFSQLKSLVKLDLANNQIEDIGEGVCTLVHLSRLLLRNNKLTSLPDNFGDMVSLTELDASFNSIETIPASVGNLENLLRLNVESNKITATPSSLCQLTKLQDLLLSHNQITKIDGSLGRMLSLRLLHADHNLITSNGLWEGGMATMKSLTRLDMGWNEITELRRSLFEPPPPSLEYLRLCNNNIKLVPTSLYKLKSLRELDLGFNCIDTLSSDIGNLVALHTICVASNQLEELPETMESLKKLSGTVDLSNNLFVDRPDSLLWKLPHIKHVIMSGCPLRPEGMSITQCLINGDLALMHGDLDGAIEHYTTVLSKDPYHFEAVQKRAKLYKQLDRVEDAIADFTTAMRTRFDDASLFFERGNLFLMVDPPQSQDALVDFRSALERNEVFWAAMIGETKSLIQIGQYGDAINICRVVIDGDMEADCVRTAKYLWGLAEFKRGNSVAAVEWFDPLLDVEVGPLPANEYEITLLRGLCFRDLGETKDAIDDFTCVVCAYDEAREEEAQERLRKEQGVPESESESSSSSESEEEEEGGDDGNDGDKKSETKEESEERKEGKEGEEEDGGDGSDKGDGGDVIFETIERIPVTDRQLEIALMNRSGAYSTMGSKKNATTDYERVHARKTNWKLIKRHKEKLERIEKEKHGLESGEHGSAKEEEDVEMMEVVNGHREQKHSRK